MEHEMVTAGWVGSGSGGGGVFQCLLREWSLSGLLSFPLCCVCVWAEFVDLTFRYVRIVQHVCRPVWQCVGPEVTLKELLTA